MPEGDFITNVNILEQQNKHIEKRYKFFDSIILLLSGCCLSSSGTMGKIIMPKFS